MIEKRMADISKRQAFRSVWRTLISLVVWSAIAARVSVAGNVVSLERSSPAVRRVDVREAPEIAPLAEKAREFANFTYPRIVDLLVEDPSAVPGQFDLIFRKSLPGEHNATTRNRRIFINTGHFNPDASRLVAESETNLLMVMVHEMAHVAEQYRGMAPFYATRAPRYWEEGIAEYVRHKLGATNATTCLECAEAYPHYTSGYSCSGAFLVYLDQCYGSNVIRRLNTALRRGSYKEGFFLANTGKELSVLWSEFQKTAAYRPDAEKAYQGQKALGYVNGRAPKDVEKRFRKYVLQQPGGELSMSALSFLRAVQKQGELPGFGADDAIWIDHGEGGRFPFGFPNKSDPGKFPASRWIFLYKQGPDDSCYQYVVRRENKEKGWEFERAWRTLKGVVVQEYAIVESNTAKKGN